MSELFTEFGVRSVAVAENIQRYYSLNVMLRIVLSIVFHFYMFNSFSSMSSFGLPMNGGGSFTSTSSSVKIVNGKRIVTKKLVSVS